MVAREIVALLARVQIPLASHLLRRVLIGTASKDQGLYNSEADVPPKRCRQGQRVGELI